jgi:hypothetical protein
MLPDYRQYDKMFETCQNCNTYDENLEPDEEWWQYPQPEQVIVNGRTTICLWDDGAKTMVRLMDGEEFNLESAVAQCICKRFISSHTAFMKLVANAKIQPLKPKKDEVKQIFDE